MLKLKLQYFGHLMRRTDSLEKTLILGKIWRQEENGTAEDEMVRWHHWLNGHEYEQAPGDGEGQGSLACCSPLSHKDSDTTEWLSIYMVFLVVMYRCESWTIKKAEHQKIDAFTLWCWRRLLRVPWTVRKSSQSILKEISPEYSLEGLTLKLKLQETQVLQHSLATWCKQPTH